MPFFSLVGSFALGASASELLGGVADLEASNVVHVEALEHFLGVGVNVDGVRVDGGAVRDVVVLALALFLLQRKRNAAHGTLGNALHQMRHVSGNLVAQTLGRNSSSLVADLLVHLKVVSQTRIVPFVFERKGKKKKKLVKKKKKKSLKRKKKRDSLFDNQLGSLLHSLGAHASLKKAK